MPTTASQPGTTIPSTEFMPAATVKQPEPEIKTSVQTIEPALTVSQPKVEKIEIESSIQTIDPAVTASQPEAIKPVVKPLEPAPSVIQAEEEVKPAINLENPGLDMDHDNIPDIFDLCIDKPGTLGDNGCPPNDTGDGDKDTIPNNVDPCPYDANNTCAEAIPATPQTIVDSVISDSKPISEDKIIVENNPLPPSTIPSEDGKKDETILTTTTTAEIEVPTPTTMEADVVDVKPSTEIPVAEAKIDRDNDEIPDGSDNCPDDPTNRCSDAVNTDIDRDGDKIPDVLDRCAELSGPESNGGCPIEEVKPIDPVDDYDGDHVINIFDDCFQVYGTHDNGCTSPETTNIMENAEEKKQEKIDSLASDQPFARSIDSNLPLEDTQVVDDIQYSMRGGGFCSMISTNSSSGLYLILSIIPFAILVIQRKKK